MDRRQQKLVYGRCQQIFAATATCSPIERGARVAEEAMECAQAFGVPLPMLLKIAARVYSREPGNKEEELGQTVVCLAAAAECVNVDLEASTQAAINIMVRPGPERIDKWARNELHKLAQGIAIPLHLEGVG